MIQEQGGWLIKPLAEGLDGTLIAARAHVLRAAGVRTPAIRLDPDRAALRIRKVDGVDGRTLLTDRADPASFAALLRQLARPVLRLHGVDPRPLRLRPYDPGLRIRPRLQGETPLQRHAAERWRALEAILCHAPVARVALHGDYHPGQLIVPRRGAPWLVDLDDMALGPPEIDHGNLVAYLVSRLVLQGTDGPTALKRLRDRLLAVPDLPELDRTTLDAAIVASLIRRALKLERRGDVGEAPAAILATAPG